MPALPVEEARLLADTPETRGARPPGSEELGYTLRVFECLGTGGRVLSGGKWKSAERVERASPAERSIGGAAGADRGMPGRGGACGAGGGAPAAFGRVHSVWPVLSLW